MPTAILVLLSLTDIILYTVRSYTNKLFAISYDGKPSMATPIFSAITGITGFLFTLLQAGGLAFPSMTTLLCGISAGAFLFLYDLGNIRAAKTGPYSTQSIIGLFGAVLLPLLFERMLWGVQLSATQMLGVISILFSFVFLNLNSRESLGIQKGFYGWVALLFFANGIYSTIVMAQQRWTGHAQGFEMIAVVFLTLAVVSVVYLVLGCKANLKTAFSLKKRSWGYALASSAALSVAMNLLVVLLGYVSASVLYPIQNSAVLILLVLLSAVRLRERIGSLTVCGIVFALAGIVALSL